MSTLEAGLSKIYGEFPEIISLKQLGAEIRTLIATEENISVALAVRLAKAKEMVDAAEDTNLTWAKWCAENVIKRNGEPYAMGTIERLVIAGRSPDTAERLKRMRETVTRYQSRHVIRGISYGQSRRAANVAPPQASIDEVFRLRKSDKKLTLDQIGNVVGMARGSVFAILKGKTKSREFYEARAKTEEMNGQVQTLVAMYERLTPEFQRQFLHAINARLITRNSAHG